MDRTKSSRPWKTTEVIFLLGCTLGLVTLLAFPIRTVHRFAEHYRTAEACRMIKRHTFVDQSDTNQTEHVLTTDFKPVELMPLELLDFRLLPATYDTFSEPPLMHLLMRMKRGSKAQGQDPPL
ncbi:MAG: hypothetical protein ACREQ4_18745 [Candidatus Binataceae bacterium]